MTRWASTTWFRWSITTAMPLPYLHRDYGLRFRWRLDRTTLGLQKSHLRAQKIASDTLLSSWNASVRPLFVFFLTYGRSKMNTVNTSAIMLTCAPNGTSSSAVDVLLCAPRARFRAFHLLSKSITPVVHILPYLPPYAMQLLETLKIQRSDPYQSYLGD